MIFGTYIRDTLSISPNDFGDPMSLFTALPACQSFLLFSEISPHQPSSTFVYDQLQNLWHSHQRQMYLFVFSANMQMFARWHLAQKHWGPKVQPNTAASMTVASKQRYRARKSTTCLLLLSFTSRGFVFKQWISNQPIIAWKVWCQIFVTPWKVLVRKDVLQHKVCENKITICFFSVR